MEAMMVFLCTIATRILFPVFSVCVIYSLLFFGRKRGVILFDESFSLYCCNERMT
eukprot:m.16188 g.16188  ORF g.16188 m.16188 type:complete len:55 (-) comp4578_c0_seq1:1352-1516(-)